MELVYIWIDKYKKFKQNEFVFTGEYTFIYEPESKKLTVSRNSWYPANLFDLPFSNDELDQRITNVSAIIGKNGAGKSTILEYICLLMRSGDIFNKELPIGLDLVIFAIPHNGLMILHDNKWFKEDINEEGPTQFEIKNLRPFKQDQPIPRPSAWLNVVYYSTGIYDRLVRENINFSNLINLSDTAYFFESNSPYVKEPGLNVAAKRFESPRTFLHEDFRRQARFININKTQQLNLLPFDHEIESFELSINQNYSNVGEFHELLAMIMKRYDVSNDAEFLRAILGTATVFGLIYPGKAYLKEPIDSQQQKGRLSELLESTSNYLDALVKFTEQHPFSKTKEYIAQFQFWAQDFKIPEKVDFIKSIDRFVNSFNVSKTWIDEGPLQNYVRRQGNKFFNPYYYLVKLEIADEFIKSYLAQLCDVTPDFLEVSLFNLSSGQRSLVNIFSRFLEGCRFEKKNSAPILILLDEAETYLHPEWQRKYVYLLLDFYRRLFTNNKVQVILTSNSPFIASDVPKCNTIFMNENGPMLRHDHLELHDTFSANIYDLFKERFFLEQGFSGEFSRRIVQIIIDYLLDAEEVNIENLLYCKKITELIGEPIIREKLLETIDERISEISKGN